jgi:PAS domain S-box-containing protein
VLVKGPDRGDEKDAGARPAESALSTVRVPEAFAPAFRLAQEYVSRYFAEREARPEQGTITIAGERYILVRAASMSVEFFDLVRSLYADKGPEEARTVASNLLYDTAHAIGKADARAFHAKMVVTSPIERLSAGPVHFAFSGWAFVDILPESRPSPDEDFFLVYDHPFSFESHAWLTQGRASPVPVCVMNAGYSSGWCEESFGLPLVAAETECLAAGGARCRFVMAPPSRIEEHLGRLSASDGVGRPRRAASVSIPEFFQRKRLEDELRRSHESLEWRVRERTAALETANQRLREEIADRQAVEEELRASEDRFSRAFRRSPAASAIATLEEGRFLDVNEAFVALVGHPRVVLLGRTALEMGIWADLDLRARVRAQLVAEGRVSDQEGLLRTASGELREVSLSAETIDLSGRRCMLVLCHDMTDRRRAEEALRLAQRMESLGVLAGGMAHDFNNLLSGVIGQASLALQKLAPDAPARSNVTKAVQAAERAAGLTRQMLAYAGRGHFEIQATDLNRVVAENLNLLAAALPKQVLLSRHLAEELPPVAGDASQLEQVVMNLVLNAAEAIGERPGTVAVTTGLREVGPNGDVRQPAGEPLPPGSYVELVVRDDGPGMEGATRSRIFEPFFTTKATGRGLGLAATHGIVRGHRGGIHVDSAPREGTTFTVLLPVSTEAPAPPPRAVSRAARVSGLVLVVDDEDAVREVVTSTLEVAGIPTLAAPDGRTAIELYRSRERAIDLVFLDLSMPGLSGEATCEELRRLDPAVRVLLTSGFSEAVARRRIGDGGIVGFLQKPYRPEVLIDAVRRAIGGGVPDLRGRD